MLRHELGDVRNLAVSPNGLDRCAVSELLLDLDRRQRRASRTLLEQFTTFQAVDDLLQLDFAFAQSFVSVIADDVALFAHRPFNVLEEPSHSRGCYSPDSFTATPCTFSVLICTSFASPSSFTLSE